MRQPLGLDRGLLGVGSAILKNMNKLQAWSAGLLQALGVTAYIIIFVLAVQVIPARLESSNPVLGMLTALLAFVTSALICGGLALGYPILLGLAGNKSRAVQIVVWTAVWLIIFFSGVIILGFAMAPVAATGALHT